MNLYNGIYNVHTKSVNIMLHLGNNIKNELLLTEGTTYHVIYNIRNY